MAYNDNPAYLKLAGGTMTGTLTLNGDPSNANDAANKSYVDAISAGLTFKTSVVCGTTANLNATYLNGAAGVGATLTNAGALVAFTIDGITPTINQRVLVKNQTSTLQNGIYTISTLGSGAVAWILTRATDYNTPSQINPGDIVPISSGTTLANTSWLQTGFVTTIGTDGITFQQYQSTPVQTTQFDILVGGAANTIVSVGPGSTGQVFQSSGNASNPAYSTATYPSTATGTGTLLRADGTNWTATTTTYPNTNAVSTLLYASSSNVMSALATANNGMLVTSSSGVPSILAGPGTTGNVLQSNSAAAPSFSTATYPSTATSTGTILRADGTNWSATTATYPNTAGTAGNYLTSDGTNIVSTSLSGLQYKSLVVTSAQVKALHATPIQLVAAPGAGKVIVLISAAGKLTYGGSNIFVAGASQVISLSYGTSPNAIGAILTNSNIVSSVNAYGLAALGSLTNTAATSLENIALNIYNSTATEISGNAAGDNTITISIFYYILNI